MPPSYPGGIAPGLAEVRGRREQRGFAARLPKCFAPVTSQSLRGLAELRQYAGPDRLRRRLERAQHAGGRLVRGSGQAEQDVLGADGVVAQRQRFPQAQLQRLLGLSGEGKVAAPPNDASTRRRIASRSMLMLSSASASAGPKTAGARLLASSRRTPSAVTPSSARTEAAMSSSSASRPSSRCSTPM